LELFCLPYQCISRAIIALSGWQSLLLKREPETMMRPGDWDKPTSQQGGEGSEERKPVTLQVHQLADTVVQKWKVGLLQHQSQEFDVSTSSIIYTSSGMAMASITHEGVC